MTIFRAWRRGVPAILLAVVFLGLAIFGVTKGAATASGGTGSFLVANYGTGTPGACGYFKRGYVFQVSQTTVITGLSGAGTSGGTFIVGLYQGTTTATVENSLFIGRTSDNAELSATPTALLGSITLSAGDSDGQQVTKSLNSNVTLQPNQVYILAQMRISEGGSHQTTPALNRQDILTHPRIARWGPERWNGTTFVGGVFRWHSAENAESFINKPSGDTNACLPNLGLQFESECNLPEVRTEPVEVIGDQITFRGMLLNTGSNETGCPAPAVELAFEVGPNSNLGVSGTFTNSSPSSRTTNGSFSLTITGVPNDTYFARAVAINEAGRREGSVQNFQFLPTPQVQAPTLASSSATELQVSANLSGLGTSDVTAHGFCRDHRCGR